MLDCMSVNMAVACYEVKAVILSHEEILTPGFAKKTKILLLNVMLNF